MIVSNKRIKRKTFEGSYNARGRYTADGKSIVFVHRKNGMFNIAIQNLVNGKMKILTNTQLDESPTISPKNNIFII